MKAQITPQPDKTSRARQTFDHSIQDAQQLLDHCESLGDPLPHSAEVFKRAGLVVAMTAWETYVEDRLLEAVKGLLAQDASHAGAFMLARLEEELKRLHNPTSEKTQKLFEDYLQVDVTVHWKWSGYDRARAVGRLNELLEKRGERFIGPRLTQRNSQPRIW